MYESSPGPCVIREFCTINYNTNYSTHCYFRRPSNTVPFSLIRLSSSDPFPLLRLGSPNPQEPQSDRLGTLWCSFLFTGWESFPVEDFANNVDLVGNNPLGGRPGIVFSDLCSSCSQKSVLSFVLFCFHFPCYVEGTLLLVLLTFVTFFPPD